MTVLLIAEDFEDIAMILIRVYKKAGMTVLHAPDGVAALELALKHRPDVILTDLGMPRMDGWELIRSVRGHDELHDTPIAILSGQLQPGDARAAEAGACTVLLKPCPKDELLTAVEQLAVRGPHRHSRTAEERTQRPHSVSARVCHR